MTIFDINPDYNKFCYEVGQNINIGKFCKVANTIYKMFGSIGLVYFREGYYSMHNDIFWDNLPKYDDYLHYCYAKLKGGDK